MKRMPGVMKPSGVLIEQVASNGPAAGKLLPTDVVTAANGRPVRTPADLRRVVGRLKAGSTVALTVRRGSGLENPPMRPQSYSRRR